MRMSNLTFLWLHIGKRNEDVKFNLFVAASLITKWNMKLKFSNYQNHVIWVLIGKLLTRPFQLFYGLCHFKENST
jgi:hypothetical protein